MPNTRNNSKTSGHSDALTETEIEQISAKLTQERETFLEEVRLFEEKRKDFEKKERAYDARRDEMAASEENCATHKNGNTVKYDLINEVEQLRREIERLRNAAAPQPRC